MNALKELDKTISKRDLPARREEILDAWEQRMFWRNVQHLLWSGVTRGFELPPVGSGYHPQDPESRSMFDVNIYTPYGEIIASALTREFPTVRTKPSDSDKDVDITAAQTAEKLIDEIKRKAGGMKSLMSDEARLLFTDGRSMKYTRYVLDAQQFGYDQPEEEVVPEDEEQPNTEPTQDGQPEAVLPGIMEPNGSEVSPANENVPGAAGTNPSGDVGLQSQPARIPRGWQITTAEGVLETQVPIKANSISECDYVRYQREISLERAKSKFPDIAEKITASPAGPAGDEIDRLARINTKIGVRNNFLTSDSQAYDVTETHLFLRPAMLNGVKERDVRDTLLDIFAETGCEVVFAGPELAYARKCSIDDHWAMTFAKPGDGAHRPSLGSALVPIQKIINNWVDLLNDYLVRGVPMKWGDSEVFDREKISQQSNMPGGWNFFKAPQGVIAGGGMVGQYYFEETIVEPPQTLLAIIQYVMNEVAQLIVGAFPALFGGDTESNDTMGGIMVQRDQALGRIGLVWRSIKESYAQCVMQMIRSLAKNHEGVIKSTGAESLTIEMSDLKGDFLCYPDTDENFPETYTQIQNRMMLLLQDAMSNPLIMQFLDDPENLQVVKDAIGLQKLKIPIVESREQQLGEIEILTKSGPAPNPAYEQAQIQFAKFSEEAQLNPQLAQALPQAQQQAQSVPEQVSTVQIHDWDDHATHIAVCEGFFRSARGRAMENGTTEEQQGFQNIVLHRQEHIAAQAQKQATAPTGPTKPVNISANVKDLPPTTAAAAIQKAGLPANPQEFAAQGVVAAQEKHPVLDLQEKKNAR